MVLVKKILISGTPEIVVTQPILTASERGICVGAVGPKRSMGAQWGSNRDTKHLIVFSAPIFHLMW